MKRIFALTLLVAFAAGPSVKWLCERVCSAEHPVAAAEGCHQPSESAQLVMGGHNCGDHASPVALITKRVLPETQSYVSPRGPAISVVSTLPVPSGVAYFTLADPSPPLSGFVAPLRI